MSVIEALLSDVVRRAVSAEVAPLLAAIEELRRRLPPQLGSIDDVVRVTGLSPATVRRRIRSGEFTSTKIGRRVLVDLAALRPADETEIARLAAKDRAPK